MDGVFGKDSVNNMFARQNATHIAASHIRPINYCPYTVSRRITQQLKLLWRKLRRQKNINYTTYCQLISLPFISDEFILGQPRSHGRHNLLGHRCKTHFTFIIYITFLCV